MKRIFAAYGMQSVSFTLMTFLTTKRPRHIKTTLATEPTMVRIALFSKPTVAANTTEHAHHRLPGLISPGQ
jgi:hypothetical protein